MWELTADRSPRRRANMTNAKPMARSAAPPTIVAPRSAPVKASELLAAVAGAGIVTSVVATFVPPVEFAPVATNVLTAPKVVATAGPPFREM
jgi:hypothetical protein